ncbi:MAG: hypothetical protein ASARMPRED_002760 [Alectoria sarmentosa]|nr:MAG: hypothetical protein ASARMPRED_002760 [Alectoria sarmentosa]
MGNLLVATAGDLQRELSSGKLASTDLVNACLDQIEKHDGYLRAMISVAPRASLVEQAQRLDDERKTNKIRGKLHGIPILIKDNIATLPELQMDTTSGSFALVGSKPKRNAAIITQLLDAGVIIVGSAIGVSAGYAPISIGTETEGSMIIPAGRAALYTIKPTIPIIPQEGLVPISSLCDSAGPMAKSVEDLANLMDVLVDPLKTSVPPGGYLSAVTAVWEGLKIGALDPEIWVYPEFRRKQEPAAEIQMKSETLEVYDKLSKLATSFHANVSLISESALEVEGDHCLPQLLAYGFKTEFEAYLNQVEDCKIHSLEELIQFNKDETETELPSRNPRQDLLESASSLQIDPQRYRLLLGHARLIGRDRGIDETFKKYDINVLVGPAESPLTVFAAATGYPIASLPLGYLDFNGRPHALAAIAAEHQEATLIQLQSAWEATFPARRPPPLSTQDYSWIDRTCQMYIHTALRLAKSFQEYSKDRPPIQTRPELGELLKNAVWYLYECGQLDDALELLEIAYETVPDKQSALYNDLKPCRDFNEKSLQIREAVLAPDDLDLVSSYHNLGGIASAQDRYDEALELLTKTEEIRVKAGAETVVSLGLTHMIVGRVHFLRKQYSAASERYDMAENTIESSPGPMSQLMAHLIYAFGNLEYAQDNITAAKELYETGHKRSHDLDPTHILTATFDYKFGVVEAQLQNYAKAMHRLQDALAVVERHQAKGDIARIFRRQAIVIRENPSSTPAQMKEADKLMEKAERIRARLSGWVVQDPSLPEDLVYDDLVCGYFRQGNASAVSSLMHREGVERGRVSFVALWKGDWADS